MLALDIDFRLPFFLNLRYTINSLAIYLMPLITPVLVLIFMFSKSKEYKGKKWLFPIAFGVKIINDLLLIHSNFYMIGLIVSVPKLLLTFLCSCLMFAAVVFIFIGTLFDFKYSNLLKYGALSCALLTFATLIVEFNAVGGFKYLQSISFGAPATYLIEWIRTLTCVLFYIGIFVSTSNKKNTVFV